MLAWCRRPARPATSKKVTPTGRTAQRISRHFPGWWKDPLARYPHLAQALYCCVAAAALRVSSFRSNGGTSGQVFHRHRCVWAPSLTRTWKSGLTRLYMSYLRRCRREVPDEDRVPEMIVELRKILAEGDKTIMRKVRAGAVAEAVSNLFKQATTG